MDFTLFNWYFRSDCKFLRYGKCSRLYVCYGLRNKTSVDPIGINFLYGTTVAALPIPSNVRPAYSDFLVEESALTLLVHSRAGPVPPDLDSIVLRYPLLARLLFRSLGLDNCQVYVTPVYVIGFTI